MAGHESHSHGLFEVPSINKPTENNFGKTYDGSDLKSKIRYGAYYSRNEILLLGNGDESLGMDLIGDGLLAEIPLEEGKEEEVFRPYDEEIRELVRDSRLH